MTASITDEELQARAERAQDEINDLFDVYSERVNRDDATRDVVDDAIREYGAALLIVLAKVDYGVSVDEGTAVLLADLRRRAVRMRDLVTSPPMSG